jgi:glycosyltransferase involved in cell wall biosynthesis
VSPSRLKVLVLIEASRLDGPIRNLLYAIELLRSTTDFAIVTFARPGLEDNVLVSHLRASGWPVIVVPERGRFDLRALRILAATIRQQAPDICQVHNTKSRLFVGWCTLILRIVSRRRLLFFFHGETWTTPLQRAYNWIDRRLFRLAARVVVVTQTQSPLLQSWGVSPERIRVIVNAIPESVARAPQISTAPQPLRLMTAGRLSAEKGHAVLVAAVAELRKRSTRALLLDIYGDGPEADALHSAIKAADLEGCVRMRGYQLDLRAAYLESELFVLPSFSEGLPNVLLEAAMAGVPIVSTAVGGVPALFADGVEARLVKPADPMALAQAIEEYLQLPQRFVQFAGRARTVVIARHGPRAKADALAALYAEINGAAMVASPHRAAEPLA